MKTTLRIAIVLLVLGVVVSMSLPAVAQAKGATGAGQEVYNGKCKMCHGADGKGDTPMGKNMKLKDLSSSDVQGMHDSELKSLIENGKGKMPAYKGKLTDKQIDDVIVYLRSFKK